MAGRSQQRRNRQGTDACASNCSRCGRAEAAGRQPVWCRYGGEVRRSRRPRNSRSDRRQGRRGGPRHRRSRRHAQAGGRGGASIGTSHPSRRGGRHFTVQLHARSAPVFGVHHLLRNQERTVQSVQELLGVNSAVGGRPFLPSQDERRGDLLPRHDYWRCSKCRRSVTPEQDPIRHDGVIVSHHAGSAQSVVQLAGRSDRGEAQDLRHLAPQELPALLALEVRSWPAADSCRASTSDSKNGARESLVGRRADRQRATA
jgi:hypothetical protein